MIELALTALFFGLKHSFDADHLIAVSNFLTPLKSLKQAFKAALSWAIGHMLTATLIAFFLFYFRETILENFLQKFEFIAAIMLIVLGIFSLMNSRILHAHRHRHDNIEHSHMHFHLKNSTIHFASRAESFNQENFQPHSIGSFGKNERKFHFHLHLFGIGLIQGLASNDELLLLLVVSMGLSSLTAMLFGIGIFSIGVMIGMVLYSAFFTMPLIKSNSEKLSQIFGVFIGILSIFYGTAMLL